MCPFFFHCQSPATVLCPSVRLLQKSSTMDINTMSCRWKPGSLFHQLCQSTMSWEPCKEVICRYYFLQWLRTWLCFVELHLWEFLCLFFISGRLNSQFQGLVLQNGCSTKWATCKLTWNPVLSYCSQVVQLWFLSPVSDRWNIPPLWTSVVSKMWVVGLSEEVWVRVPQSQRVMGLLLPRHFLSLYLVFWLLDGSHTFAVCRNLILREGGYLRWVWLTSQEKLTPCN